MPEHVGHRRDGRERAERGIPVVRVERGVAGPHGLVDDRERLRHAEVVIHRRDERLGQIIVASAGHGAVAGRADEEPADALERGGGLVERGLRDVEARAVVRGGERVAHDERVAHGEQVVGEHEVAERLRHLLVADRDEAVVHPVARERVAGRGRLRELVLVVREAQVEAAAVDVELGPEVAPRHRGALDVPAGTAAAPRRLPRRALGLARLRALPEREVPRVALAARVGVLGRLHRVEGLVRQAAVVGPRTHVEVHVARSRVPRRVGVPARRSAAR